MLQNSPTNSGRYNERDAIRAFAFKYTCRDRVQVTAADAVIAHGMGEADVAGVVKDGVESTLAWDVNSANDSLPDILREPLAHLDHVASAKRGLLKSSPVICPSDYERSAVAGRGGTAPRLRTI